MKLLWKAILLVVSTFSIFLLMSHFYLNRITTPFYLEKFVEELDVMEIVEKENLHQINDEWQLLELITKLMDDNPEQVRQYVEDDNKAIINFFIGQTMKKSNRCANPNKSLEIIKCELEKRKNNESK